MPQNIAEFRIIGRIGKITPRDKVIYVTVAANYNRRDGDGWKSDPHWNSVGFLECREQIEAADKGDLVHITGRVRETSHGEGNEVAYRTELGRVRQCGVNSGVAIGLHFQAALGVICSG
jgi:single-strand DNA-binding protein